MVPPPGLELAPPTAAALPLNLTNTLTNYHGQNVDAMVNMSYMADMDMLDEVETFEVVDPDQEVFADDSADDAQLTRPRRPKSARK